MSNTPETPETNIDETVESVPFTQKVKDLAKKYLLPATVAVAGITALVVVNHGRRIDELEDSSDALILEMMGDDEDTVVLEIEADEA